MIELLHADSLEVSLTVSQIENSAAWYCKALGFIEDRRHERDGRLVAISLRAGAVRILLTKDDGNKGTDRVKGEGFSIQITTSQSAYEIAARIKAYGGLLDSEPALMPWGVTAFRIRDLDGFWLTISSTHVVSH
jgi:uncharacterized glyoxalase superfamily protein PhnB